MRDFSIENHPKNSHKQFIENFAAMNLYGLNSTLFGLGFSEAALLESISSSHPMITDRRHGEREEEDLLKLSNSILKNIKRNSSPPKRRHDGTSPLPLGMDWSPSPLNWDGKNTIWPHDFHTGWSYCVTVPSFSIFAESRGSEPVAFYRVQIGLQSPEGVTTTHGVLRRYSDFLKLSSDLKRCFHKKKLPSVPPKELLRVKNRTLLEERRCSLEDWIVKVLSDIDFSRSVPVACFLELEAAARSAFREPSDNVPNINLNCSSSSSSDVVSSQTDVSVIADTSALESSYDNEPPYQTSGVHSNHYVKDNYSEFESRKPVSDNDYSTLTKANLKQASSENNNSTLTKELSEGVDEKLLQKFFDESPPNGKSSAAPSEISTAEVVHQDRPTSSKCSKSAETPEALEKLAISDLQFSSDMLVILPLHEQQKMNRLLGTVQQRLVTSRTDVEDLVARLNQELAVRQYLTTKVKDLETELESTKQTGKENLEQAISIERERFTQMQWDMEELNRTNMELEFKLKAEQDKNACAEATKTSIAKENEMLCQELDSARKQLKNLHKHHEEADLKSKSDVKLLVREVKSRRGSQSELQKKLDSVSKERLEFEERLQEERTIRECVDSANRKMLLVCEALRGQLKECSIDFLVETEKKLKMEFPPDAIEILATSESRLGLLLAEAQLLAQSVVNHPVASLSHGTDNLKTVDDELRKMIADVLIENAVLRKQANSVTQCALNVTAASVIIKDDTAPSCKTLISNSFER